MDLKQLLTDAVLRDASDIHLTVGAPPTIRLHGDLLQVGEMLRPADTEEASKVILNEENHQRFLDRGELDVSYSLPGVSRFRVNVYRQRGTVSLAIRVVPSEVPQFEKLQLPSTLLQFTELQRGLVLVTGPTGSGKSTTLASLIDVVNRTKRKHIITLEDPIEYLHRHRQCLIDQREIGQDTTGFAPALRAALRQDPDVILVGELRDLETIQTAVTASETGHLVFATLHTGSAVQTVDRLIDVFPSTQQSQIRVQLASVLAGVVTQKLCKTPQGTGRVVACEILFNTPAVANLIRTEKTHQIRSVMQTGRQMGMRTMEMHVRDLAQQGLIAQQELAASVLAT